MLPLLPQGTAPVSHTQQHVFKKGGPLQADDGSIVGPHTGLAIIWMLLALHSHITTLKAHNRCLHDQQASKHTHASMLVK